MDKSILGRELVKYNIIITYMEDPYVDNSYHHPVQKTNILYVGSVIAMVGNTYKKIYVLVFT